MTFFLSFSIVSESGAVFIIGDSGLKNNQENYFFIKNDPVQKIFANNYGQNGVVCGRKICDF